MIESRLDNQSSLRFQHFLYVFIRGLRNIYVNLGDYILYADGLIPSHVDQRNQGPPA
jgi:hypothetical protein